METAVEHIISATEARVHFGEVIRRVVDDQETIIVQRSGEPAAVLISIAHYKRLITTANDHESWQDRVDLARELIAAELKDGELMPAEEIIRRMREERDVQLLDLH